MENTKKLEKIRIEKPGLPSGVCEIDNFFSIPDSQPHAITEVAKPVKLEHALRAH